VDTNHLLHGPPDHRRCVGLVDYLHHDRNRRQLPQPVGAGKHAIAKVGFALAEFDGFGAQHHVRKIHVPGVRWNVRTLGHVADVAEITLIDDLAEVFPCHAVDLAALALVDQIEQGRKCIAKTYAAPASVTDIEDAFQLRIRRGLVEESRIAPVEGMAGRRFEATFAHGFRA
jgi:hypothetical protein